MLKANPAPIAALALLVSVSVTGQSSLKAATKSKPQEPLISFGMTCTPQIIGPNDQVHLTIPMPHGGELGIETPTGALEYVAFYPDGLSKPEYVSTLEGPEFINRRKIDIDIKNISTARYKEKRSIHRRIFTVNGRYKIYIAKNFDDYMLPWAPWCDLEYRNPADPRPPPPRIYFLD